MTEGMSKGESFAARRGIACLLFSLASAAWTLQMVMRVIDGPVNRPIVIGWLGWQVVPLVWVFVGPGRLRRIGLSQFSAADIAVIHDELTRDHRRKAAMAGYVLLLAGMAVSALDATGMVAVPAWWPIVALGAGVVGAGVVFAVLDMRAQ